MLSLKLAFRNLFRNTRRTVLTSILISSSLIVLILVDGMVLGMIDLMVGGITHTLEGEAQVNRKGFRDNFEVSLYLDNPEEILSILDTDELVAGAGPRVIVGGMIASSYNTTGGLIYGVDAERETHISRLRDATVSGKYLSGQERPIMISRS